MRHDFDDQIQVRYQHGDGQEIDAWVSGSEAQQRLRSEIAEEELKSLSRLSANDLKLVIESLPEMTKKVARESLRKRLAGRLEDTIGGSVIGDALSESFLGSSRDGEQVGTEKERWQALIQYDPFRQKVLELAWIQLEGSFPESEAEPPADDWL